MEKTKTFAFLEIASYVNLLEFKKIAEWFIMQNNTTPTIGTKPTILIIGLVILLIVKKYYFD